MNTHLSHADWFDLHRSDSRTVRQMYATHADFFAAAEAQARRNLNRAHVNDAFHVESIQSLLDDANFPSALMQFDDGEHLPVLSWHATQDVAAVRSIAKHGYVLPNDLVPTTGFTLKMSNGNYLGEGTYSSSEFDVAQWFSFLDRDGSVQLLLNWVALGQLHYCADDPPERIVVKDVSGYNARQDIFWRKVKVVDNPAYDRGIVQSVHGVFGNGAHTRTVPGLRVLVSGDARRVRPIAIVTLRPNWDNAKIASYVRAAHASFRAGNTGRLIEVQRTFHFNERERADPVRLYRVCNDGGWHVVEPPWSVRAQVLSAPLVTMRHHMIAPLRLLRADRVTAQQLGALFGALSGGAKRLWMHDERGVVAQHTDAAGSADQFASLVGSASSAAAHGERALDALAAALDCITNVAVTYDENDGERDVDQLEVIYLVLDAPLERNAMLALCDRFDAQLGVRSVVLKVLAFGEAPPDFDQLANLKYRLQTRSDAFEQLVHHVPNALSWADTVETVLDENSGMLNYFRIGRSYDVPFPFGVVGEGFVSDLAYNPLWREQRAPDVVLYKGTRALPALGVNGGVYPVEYVTRDALVAQLLLLARPRVPSRGARTQELAEERAAQAELRERYGAAVGHFCVAITRVLCRFRSFVVRSAGRVAQYRGVVATLCGALMTELRDVARHETLAQLVDLALLRRTAHHAQTLLSDINAFADVKLAGEWFERLMAMKFAKAIAKRAIVLDTRVDARALLAAEQQRGGIRIRTRSSAAAQIEPWMIIVDDVATARATIAAAFESQRSDAAFDVLPDGDPRAANDNTLRMYYAFVFSRHPHIFMISQPFALLTVTWVRALETIFRSTTEVGAGDWQQCWSLAERVRDAFERDAPMLALLRAIDDAPADALAQHLTEAADVTSPCRLLGALLRPEARALQLFQQVESPKYRAFAFALLAECVMRGARAFLRSNNRAATDELRRVLGIVVGAANDVEKLDIAACAARTGAFYRACFTNCSPHALVAALSFIERWHAGAECASVAADFASRERVSMRHFLHTHLPGHDGRATQLALYLQGVRYNRARFRAGLRFADPSAIVRDVFAEQSALAAAEHRVLLAANDRRARRAAERQRAAEPFRRGHAVVRLWTPSEVDEHNAKVDDRSQWLELLDTGLLKHHCCAVNCPDFMRNLATSADLQRGSRHGMRRHLQHCQTIGMYVPSLHVAARQFARTSASFDACLEQLDERFATVTNYKRFDRAQLVALLRDIYEFHQRSLGKK
jgi:hypothetical protein